MPPSTYIAGSRRAPGKRQGTEELHLTSRRDEKPPTERCPTTPMGIKNKMGRGGGDGGGGRLSRPHEKSDRKGQEAHERNRVVEAENTHESVGR